MGKVLDIAPAIIIGVITAGVGSAIAAEVMIASTAATSALAQGLVSATQMSGAVASAISSSVVGAGVQLIRTGDVNLEQMIANAAQGAVLNTIEAGITQQVGQEYQNLAHFGVQTAAELAAGAKLENALIHQTGGALIAAAGGNPNKIPIGKASGEGP